MRTFIYILLLFIFQSLVPLNAQTRLQVLDPQTWRSEQGQIEKAFISVEPKGGYAAVDLYLTIGQQGYSQHINDQLEIVLHFTLPDHAIVTDSWLWIEEDIIRAEHIDKWRAVSIYEGIVNRQKDPSLLIKNARNHYTLRIYPLFFGDTRKIKISYLTPISWTNKQASVPLPVDILNTCSLGKPFPTTIQALNGFQHMDVSLLDEQGYQPLEALNGQVDEPTKEIEFFSNTYGDKFELTYEDPNKDIFHLETFEHPNGASFYQLLFWPDTIARLELSNDADTATHHLIVIDHDAHKTRESVAEVQALLQHQLLSNLDADDHFNIAYESPTFTIFSDQWVPATSSNIKAAISSLGQQRRNVNSDLPQLLHQSLNFVEQQKLAANIYLITSTDELNEDIELAFALDFLTDLHPELPPILIADYGLNKFKTRNWINGKSYYGNQRFLDSLSQLAGGTYYAHEDFGPAVSSVFSGLGQYVDIAQFSISGDSLFTFNEFNVHSLPSRLNTGAAVLQTGQYFGKFPATLELNYVFDRQLYHFEIDLDEIHQDMDSSTAQIAVGNFNNLAERTAINSDDIEAIVDRALDYRTLSKYTAFLCLEPSLGGEICLECLDGSDDGGGILVSVAATEKDRDTILRVYPNPFSDIVNIELSLAKEYQSSEVQMQIVDVQGRVVKTFGTPDQIDGRQLALTWDGRSGGTRLSSGVYYFQLTTPSGNIHKQILFMPLEE